MHRDARCGRWVGGRAVWTRITSLLLKSFFGFFFGHWQWRIQEATGPLAGVRRTTSDIASLDNNLYMTLWGSLRLNRLPSSRRSMGHGSSGQPTDELPHWAFGSSTGRCVLSKSRRWQVLHCAGAGQPCTQVEGRRRMAPTIWCIWTRSRTHACGENLTSKPPTPPVVFCSNWLHIPSGDWQETLAVRRG